MVPIPTREHHVIRANRCAHIGRPLRFQMRNKTFTNRNRVCSCLRLLGRLELVPVCLFWLVEIGTSWLGLVPVGWNWPHMRVNPSPEQGKEEVLAERRQSSLNHLRPEGWWDFVQAGSRRGSNLEPRGSRFEAFWPSGALLVAAAGRGLDNWCVWTP